jgi:hypothetical protein
MDLSARYYNRSLIMSLAVWCGALYEGKVRTWTCILGSGLRLLKSISLWENGFRLACSVGDRLFSESGMRIRSVARAVPLFASNRRKGVSSPKSELSGARLFNSLELDWPFAEARGEGWARLGEDMILDTAVMGGVTAWSSLRMRAVWLIRVGGGFEL